MQYWLDLAEIFVDEHDVGVAEGHEPFFRKREHALVPIKADQLPFRGDLLDKSLGMATQAERSIHHDHAGLELERIQNFRDHHRLVAFDSSFHH